MIDEEAHLRRHVPLLRPYGHDVVHGQCERVENGGELPACELTGDLPRRAPAEAETFAHPAVQQFAVVAVEIALHANRDVLAGAPEVPPALLSALQVECEAIVIGEI